MNLKLSSGIRVSIKENETSKFLLFDRPVRVIELTKEETIKLGSSLIGSWQTGVTAELRNLISSRFFSEPKSFSDIKTELFQKEVKTKATSLNTILTKMVKRGELKRIGKKRSYLYQESILNRT